MRTGRLLRSLAVVARASRAAAVTLPRAARLFTSVRSIQYGAAPVVSRMAQSLSRRSYASGSLPEYELVEMPALSPTMEQGNIIEWLKAEGDEISAGDAVAEIETDKAKLSFESQEDGYLAKILLPAGTEGVNVGVPIFVMVADADDVAAFKDFTVDGAAAPAPAAAPAEAPAESAPAASTPTPAPAAAATNAGGRVFASPLAKKTAAENNVDLSGIQGSGPNNRIVAADVNSAKGAAAAPVQAVASTPKPAAAPAAPRPAPIFAAGDSMFEDIPNSNIRKTIARRLTESKQSIPHYYLSTECRIDTLMAMRQKLNAEEVAQGEYKLSVNDFLIKASAASMSKVPEVNSAWMEDFVRQYHNVDVSVAVSTDTGLITPIVKNAHAKGLSHISNEVKELAGRAKAGGLRPEEFQGGTFTISNLGMFGVSQFTAIINPPQSCILSVGTTMQKVLPAREGTVAMKNKKDALAEAGFTDKQIDSIFNISPAVEVSNVMTVTLGCDHRVVDGAVGAQWLKVFKQNIENPARLIL